MRNSQSRRKVIAFATRVGNLYFLEVCRARGSQQLNTAQESKERLWHHRYGHLGEHGLHKLARDRLVKQFDYNAENGIGFCESCIGGKHHRSSFETSKSRATEPLELVHSDVCVRSRLEEPSIF